MKRTLLKMIAMFESERDHLENKKQMRGFAQKKGRCTSVMQRWGRLCRTA